MAGGKGAGKRGGDKSVRGEEGRRVSPTRSQKIASCICSVCDEVVEENCDCVECGLCKEWCHKACAKLTEEHFRLLQRSGDDVWWVCARCRRSDSPSTSERSRMEAKMDTMLEMMTALSLRVLKMEGERKESRVEERIEETVEKKVSEYMEEAKEREKRKLNVIVVNVPECESENAEERQKHDLEALSEMIAKVADVTKEDLGNPVRLGARVIGKKSKPRMMKVTIKSEEAKKKLMTNAHKLNVGVKEPSKRVYFNHDRTEKERADYRKLRAELRGGKRIQVW
jgi:hypothetical protein